MKALVTGSASGLGKQFALYLSSIGYDLILVDKDEKGLKSTSSLIETKVEYEVIDLCSTYNCITLFNKHKNIDILINNAGFGLCGEFINTKVEKELDMIDLNIKALHTLTKLYLKEMVKKDSGYILNISSISAYSPGPMMATYYASKSYVLHLTEALYQEIKEIGSNVYIGCVCPGPISTNFDKTANSKFNIKYQTSEEVVKYSIKKMFKNKLIIVPGLQNKLLRFVSNLIPVKLKLKIAIKFQKKRK